MNIYYFTEVSFISAIIPQHLDARILAQIYNFHKTAAPHNTTSDKSICLSHSQSLLTVTRVLIAVATMLLITCAIKLTFITLDTMVCKVHLAGRENSDQRKLNNLGPNFRRDRVNTFSLKLHLLPSGLCLLS